MLEKKIGILPPEPILNIMFSLPLFSSCTTHRPRNQFSGQTYRNVIFINVILHPDANNSNKLLINLKQISKYKTAEFYIFKALILGVQV